MPAQWTAELIGKMHLNSITQKELADYICSTTIYSIQCLTTHIIYCIL